jgi:hypothetical protein
MTKLDLAFAAAKKEELQIEEKKEMGVRFKIFELNSNPEKIVCKDSLGKQIR